MKSKNMTGQNLPPSKEKYRSLCRAETTIPLFCRDWWLDAVTAGEKNWDVLLFEKNKHIAAAWPYVWKKRWGFYVIEMPALTQHLGPWIDYPPGQKYPTRLSYEKEILTDMIRRLPDFDIFWQKFHYSFENWLPFHWQGFEQTTLYTYVLEDIHDPASVFEGFRSNIRREIRKAEKRVTIRESDDLEAFFKLNKMVFDRQNLKLPYSLERMRYIDAACRQHKCRKIFFASDDQGRTHAALYLVWDENSAYYLMGGSDPQLRNSGAFSLLMWQAIKFAGSVTRKFDFEGSMIEPVERYFRSFGARQIPYFRIYKTRGLAGFLFALRRRYKVA